MDRYTQLAAKSTPHRVAEFIQNDSEDNNAFDVVLSCIGYPKFIWHNGGDIMSVGFRYSGIWKEFGDSNLLHAFFSTISYHLESNKWGSQYPYLLKKFYYEKLDAEETSNALEELKDIYSKFTELKQEDIIWDSEDLTKKPPVWFLSQTGVTNLSDSFTAVSGKNIFDLLSEVFEFCKRRGISVKIQSSSELIK